MTLFILFLADVCCSLMVQEVIDSSKQHFPLILSAINQLETATAENFSAYGPFDPLLISSAQTQVVGYYQYTTTELKLEQLTRLYGSKWWAGYLYSNGQFPVYLAELPTFTAGKFLLGFQMPFLKNRNIDEKRAKLWISEQKILATQAEKDSKQLSVLKNAYQKYWDWYVAAKKLLIGYELLSLTQQQRTAIQARIQKGELAAVDLLDNDRAIFQRNALVANLEQSFQKASLELSLFFRDSDGHPKMPPLEFVPTDETILNFKALLESIQKPINNIHPEVQKFSYKTEQANIGLQLARNNLLPEVNFKAYTAYNIGQNSHNSFSSKIYYTPPLSYPWELVLHLSFQIPLGMHQAQGETQAALFDLHNLHTMNQYTQEQLQVTQKTAILSMQLAQKRYEFLNNEVKVALQLEKFEKLRSYQGDSNLFFIIMREQSTRDAMMKELDAVGDFYKAYAEFLFSSNLF